MNRLFRDVGSGSRCPHGSVVCIGAFDGLHLGHQALVRHAVGRARELSLPSVALTFEPLPREFFAGSTPPPRLLLPRDKIEQLLEMRVDHVGMLRFDARLSALSAEDFVRRVLVDYLTVREVWVGPGFRFGKDRCGDLALMQQLGGGSLDSMVDESHRGFFAGEIAPVLLDGERVSSTRIRAALRAGDFTMAARLLGRPYALGGRVVQGRQLGRTLGFPTANLRLSGKQPALSGIFATWVHNVAEAPVPGVASLGTRPTVGGGETLLEVHLFDFAGDLYGRRIEVEFVARLRDETKFADLAQLTAQMQRDARQARAHLMQERQRAIA